MFIYPNFDIHDDRHKMISSSKGAEFSRKQDENTKTKASSSSTTPWLKQKDPRIVRVSRAFGGKDRHSKVCTVRGLRDRRVRLSVPTAIQLYDLQDRLGLNQPSKVVDWLLNAAKDEIDELPPLQMPPSGNFLHHPVLSFHQDHQDMTSPTPQDRSKISNIIDWGDPFGLTKSNMWISNSHLSLKSKEAAERENTSSEKHDWNKRNEQEKEVDGGFEGSNGEQQGQVLLSNFFPVGNNPNSSLPSFLTNVLPCGSFYHLEPSNYSLSQFGSSPQQHGTSASQGEDFNSFNVLPLQSATAPFGSHVYISPPPLASATQTYFHSHSAARTDCVPREVGQFQTSSSFANSLTSPSYSISQLMRPSFHLSMASVQHDEDGRQETSN